MTSVKNSDIHWLGKVASDWEIAPAWRVMKERGEKSLPDDVHLTPSQTHGVLTQQDYMDRTGNKVVLNLAGTDNMKRVRAGDFIIHLRSFQGGIEASAIDGKVSNAYTVLTPEPDAHFGYYRWFMKSVPLIEGLASSTDQLRDGQSINFSRFSRLSLPLPPLETQQRIADYLDRETAEIDAAVADLDKYVELLEKRRRVVIINSVTGRCKESEGGSTDKLSSPTFMDDQEMGGIDWLGKVNSSWGYAPLFTLGSPKKTPNTGMVENNLLSLSYGRIVRRDIESSEGLVPASYENYQIVEPGDLVLRFTDLQNDQRSLRSGLVRERGIITSAYLSFTPDEKKLSPLFFAYLMRAADLSKVFYRMGSGVRQSLNWGELSLMRLPLPSLEVQHRIADYLDQETSEIDFLISKSTKLRDLLLKRRSVLITEVVTGRKQV